VAAVLLTPDRAGATGRRELHLPYWSMAPFALLLLCIANLPLVAEHWWHKNSNKALVSAALAIPTGLYLVYLQLWTGQPALERLSEKLIEYVSFIALLGSLYTVSGGIVVAGDLPARPAVNTLILGAGAAVANLIGTTGASMLLIRPLLRINAQRRRKGHLPLFFIITVSNTGGLLTPLGDPPLFLGFLNGVPFGWTFTLWREWLVVNGAVLALFFAWDTWVSRGEPAHAQPMAAPESLRLKGLLNFIFLAGIIGAVLLQSVLTGFYQDTVPPAIMIAMGLLSLRFTPRALRQANGFSWEPIVEVAVLFIGIFVTMVPALAILEVHGADFGLSEPWQYFWLTGILSSFLDNAPTYLTLATVAAGTHPIGWLAANQPHILRAISCGAVFMGALTYIGNGPNFMVKAIAEQAGYPLPSFLAYLMYSLLVLGPGLLIVTVLFF
jgi:Na+/H+ antiporter NhaD/arsenite permease-like protein